MHGVLPTFRGQPLQWSDIQARALQRMRTHPAHTPLLLGLPMGCGKTLLLLAAAALARERNPNAICIFVIPPALFASFVEHARELLDASIWTCAFPRTKKDVHALTREVNAIFVSQCMLTNLYADVMVFKQHAWTPRPSAHAILSASGFWACVFRRTIAFVGIDEAHHYVSCDPSMPSTSAVRLLCERASMRVASTGTPVLNSESDCVGILRAMGLAANVRHYAETSLGKRGRVHADNAKQFRETYLFRVDDSEHLKTLPPLHERIHTIAPAWTPHQKRAYNEHVRLAKQYAKQAATSNTPRERERAQAKLMVSYHALFEAAFEHKQAEITQIVNRLLETHAKVILVSCYVRFLIAIRCPETWKSQVYTGEETQARREIILREFRAQAERRVLLLSEKAGGEGLQIHEASAMVFLSPSFSVQLDKQCIARIHRRGQTRACEVVHLVCEGTIDEGMREMHEDKLTLASHVLETQTSETSTAKWRRTGLSTRLRCV